MTQYQKMRCHSCKNNLSFLPSMPLAWQVAGITLTWYLWVILLNYIV